MLKDKNKKTTLAFSEDIPLYSNNMWCMTLADLYMVLLVFFILLNTISAADKIKEKKAVDSVNKSFSKNDYIDNNADKEEPLLDFPSIVASYLNSIEGLMRGAFQLDEININRSGNKMIVKLPTDNFFESGQAVIKDKHRKLFKSLSEIILQKINGTKIGTDILVESKAFSDSSINGSYQIDVDRAKVIADKLIFSGISSDEISSGVSFGSGNSIVMKFTVIDGSVVN